MINWFEVIVDKLTTIEEEQKELRALLIQSPTTADGNPYGSFKWLSDTCVDIPQSTLRIKSASGEIPGVVKFGKRVLYDKAAVLNWLRSQTRQAVDKSQVEQFANQQVDSQLQRHSRKKEVAA